MYGLVCTCKHGSFFKPCKQAWYDGYGCLGKMLLIRFLLETACDSLQFRLVASDIVLEKGVHTFIDKGIHISVVLLCSFFKICGDSLSYDYQMLVENRSLLHYSRDILSWVLLDKIVHLVDGLTLKVLKVYFWDI
jgi:hypothetical protein